MNLQNFYTQLTIVTVFTAIILFLLNQATALQPYQMFSWICLVFFLLLTLIMYYFGERASKSKNKNDFTNTVIGFMAGKMMLAGIIIVMYSKLVEPVSKIFILPFFVVYIIFTTFETYFMMKVGKENA